MTFFFGVMIFAFAGVVNGSFALPSKKLSKWPYERIWLHYSFWAFLLFPLLLIGLFAPHAWVVYSHAPASQLGIILMGGFLFAVGQICFSRALESIGLSLGFLLNISIGTALGSMVPLVMLHANQMATPAGMVTMVGVACIVLGVLLSYVAGLQREQQSQHAVSRRAYYVGVIQAVLAGLFSAGQNITFSFTQNLQYQALQLGVNHLMAANIIWPAFLMATFIPYALYMFYLRFKSRGQAGNSYRSLNYYIATMIMGAFWYFSLILYSAGSLKLGALGPVIGWPLFMVCIILTANMWGWRQGEWQTASHKAKRFAKLSVLTLVLAVCVLAYASFLSIGV